MPRTLHTYTVVPSLPERLAPLREMAYNLRWAWDHATRALFQSVDADLWETSEHNPAKLLGLVAQSRLSTLASDAAFLDQMDGVHADFMQYLQAETWWQRTTKDDAVLSASNFKIAYFSAEFGLTECLPIYSGGLGVLAGDHLKSASDLGLPLVGMGFLYQKGYFRQALNADGWQVENKPTNDFYSLPIETVKKKTETGEEPLTIAVSFPGRQVWAQVWKAQVGRIPLYLLDTNLSRNSEADRQIAGNLYGGDEETRIQQEIVLGIGGIHALAAMDIHPTVCHMNEGHSAFLALERIRRLVQEDGLSFADATEASAAGNIFTTHTPVPAGFDVFPADLMRRYFADFARDVHLPLEELLNRGRADENNPNGGFNMAILAFRHARAINGVSKLHGQVSRQMAQMAFPDIPQDEVPVGSVTNGIHTRSFLSHEMVDLLRKYVGEPTGEALSSMDYWAGVDCIPDAELWQMHEGRRNALVNWARHYQVDRLNARGASEREVHSAEELLDPKVLTIGFARRFATYKRGDLLLHDPDRIIHLLQSSDRPVQFVFAGKAHPKDDDGKKLIQHLIHFARERGVENRLVFLEDYDMAMARQMVQGVDVWLNNPRRPQEASGTSGMKVVPNGGLNFSVLDGWWAEAYEPSVGWEIGRGQIYEDTTYQDHVESQDLYETLERDIAPLFYDRNADGLPLGWIARMKASMKKLAPVFNTSRMVREYAENYYIPTAHHADMLCEAGFGVAKSLVQWKRRVRMAWGEVRVENVQFDADKMRAGEAVSVHVRVHLGASLSPSDVSVQLYTSLIDADRHMMVPQVVALENQGVVSGGVYQYAGHLPSDQSGMHAFSVRVLPANPNAVLPQELPLIAWE